MVQRIFRRAFAICSNRSFVVPALLVSVAMTLVVRTVTPAMVPPQSSAFDWHIFVTFLARFAMAVAVGILSLWPYGSLLSLAIAVARGETSSFLDRWLSLGLFLRLLLVEVVAGLVMVVGLLCFLVPGVFVMIVWSQVRALLVDGRASFFDALEASQNLTRGSRPDVFAAMLCMWMLSAAVLGLGFGFGKIMGPTSWSFTLLSLSWSAPLSAFSTAFSAALYIEVLTASRPLTRSEFFLAPPDSELAH
jgi:hypothetical protein